MYFIIFLFVVRNLVVGLAPWSKKLGCFPYHLLQWSVFLLSFTLCKHSVEFLFNLANHHPVRHPTVRLGIDRSIPLQPDGVTNLFDEDNRSWFPLALQDSLTNGHKKRVLDGKVERSSLSHAFQFSPPSHIVALEEEVLDCFNVQSALLADSI